MTKPKEINCPYCENKAQLVSSTEIYDGKDYGPAYLCKPCWAYVGCHPGTTIPLGSPANAILRQWRKNAHAAFDPVWKKRYERRHAHDKSYSKGMARSGRYKQLAKLMKLSSEDCHIAMFDIEQCKQVVMLCSSTGI